MRRVGCRYVHYFNRRYRRTGTLWEGRFRSSLVQSSTYLLTCSRYIDLNPVRAGMVEHAADYEWSSFRHLAYGAPDDLVSPHQEYLELGETPDERQARYRALCDEAMSRGAGDAIRRATRSNAVVGDDEFTDRIEASLRRRITRGWVGGRQGMRPPAVGTEFVSS